jgi:hypothetical protein
VDRGEAQHAHNAAQESAPEVAAANSDSVVTNDGTSDNSRSSAVHSDETLR